jgi:hypothetical protein
VESLEAIYGYLKGSVLDPSTRKATAFYAALGVAVWDSVRHGINLYNGAALLALAGVIAADTLFGRTPKTDEP